MKPCKFDVKESFVLKPIGTSLENECCPCGISSKELFFKLKYHGRIANYLGDRVKIGVMDLDGTEGLAGSEGSPVKVNGEVVGIRLPNLYNKTLFTTFALFLPINYLFG